MADLLDSILGAIGPTGAAVVGALLVLATIGYLVYVIQLGREGQVRRPATSGNMRSATAATSNVSAAKSCPHCSVPLLGSEFARANCPSCGKAMR